MWITKIIRERTWRVLRSGRRGEILAGTAVVAAFIIGAVIIGSSFSSGASAQSVQSDLPTAQNTIVARVFDPSDQPTNIQPLIIVSNGQLHVSVPEPKNSFRPGKYKLKLWIWQNGIIYFTENDFTWGVLAVNFNKSIYNQGDKAKVGFGVLDNKGHTICNANIGMDVSSPSGKVSRFSTTNKTITRNSSCGPGTVTNKPDYSASLAAGETGTYNVSVLATTANGTRQISDSFEVQNPPLFDVERYAPTRIYPPAPYNVYLTIKANADFSGNITETVPASFNISAGGAQKSFTHETQTLSWPVNLKKGDSKTLGYLFKAPDISPELYKLGPLQIGNWQEARQWQIAADAIANTVIFISSTVATTWTVPADWNNSSNTIEVIGGGGGGGASTGGGGGGGGGAYAKISKFTTSTTGGTVRIEVGSGGTSGVAGQISYFNWNGVGSTSTCSAGTMSVCAAAGARGLDAAGGAGGTTANSVATSTFGVGTSTFAGGAGANGTSTGTDSSGGGGGAAGPGGGGQSGGLGDSNIGNTEASGGGGGAGGGSSTAGAQGGATGALGGDGPSGTGHGTGSGDPGDSGGGGSGGNDPGNGGAGGDGIEWTQSSDSATGGAGGGGGGGGDTSNVGGAGGRYGGGGGGVDLGTNGGTGGQGIIVITYTPRAIILADGTQPAGVTIGPGANATTSAVFTFQTNDGTSTITLATTTVSTSTGIFQIQITNDAGTTVYGSSTNPTSSIRSISLSGMNVSTTLTQFRILIKPLDATSMPAVPGGTYVITSTLTAWADSKGLLQDGANTTSSPVTIDNASPGNVSNASGTASSGQVNFSWDNPGDTDFATTTIVRTTSTTGVTWVPTEGIYYTPGQAVTATNTIACVVASSTSNCTDTSVVNGTTYYYKIFTADNFLNYSGPQSSATAFTSPASGVDDNATGTLSWSNPSNVTSSDDQYATTAVLPPSNTPSNYLKATDFGFSIPTEATVAGIVVEVERKDGITSSFNDVDINIVKNNVIQSSTNKSTGASWPSTDTYASFGNSTDLWGQTWTPTDINSSTFGFALSGIGNSGISESAYVDHIRIKVFYTIASIGVEPTGNPFTPGGNSPPTVSNVVLNHTNAIILTPNATTSFDINWSVSDPQGCTDINTNKATSTAFRNGVSGTCAKPNPTTSSLSCYLYVTRVTSTCSVTTINVTDTVQIYYFAQSSGNASSSFPSDHWGAYAIASDLANTTSSASSTAVDVNVLLAINVTTSSINYGTVNASSTTGAVNQTATVQNVGNASQTLQIYGSALTLLTNSIATSSQQYATSTFSYGAGVSLSDIATAVSGFLLTAPTSTTAVQGTTFWGIGVPAGKATGTYSGTDVFTAIFSQ
ncbi:MAG: hypothetical protein Q8P49_00780 [Candidatus Liptonbacteria bacterium]|nr:hypothetical protein [Candidatus Liptonbacteria bacterium]